MKGLWSTILPDLLRETQSHQDWALLSLWTLAALQVLWGALAACFWSTETLFSPCSMKQCFIHTWVRALSVSAISSPQLSAHTPNLWGCVCIKDQGCHFWIDASLCLTRLCRFSTLCEQRPNTHTHTHNLKFLKSITRSLHSVGVPRDMCWARRPALTALPKSEDEHWGYCTGERPTKQS